MGEYTLQHLFIVMILTILCVIAVLTLVVDKKMAINKNVFFSKRKQLTWMLLLFGLVQLVVFMAMSEKILAHVSVSFLFLFWPSFYLCLAESHHILGRNKSYIGTFYFSYVLALLVLIEFFIHDLYDWVSEGFLLLSVVVLSSIKLYYLFLIFKTMSKVQQRTPMRFMLFCGLFLSSSSLVLVVYLAHNTQMLVLSLLLFTFFLLLLSLGFFQQAIAGLRQSVPGESKEIPVTLMSKLQVTGQREDHWNKYTKSAIDPMRLQTAKGLLENLAKDYFFDSSLSLHQLAHVLGLTKYELSYLFSNQLNTNFNQYVNTIRVAKAKELLLAADCEHLSVKEIGVEVGFSSNTSFYRAFKEHYTLPPLAYRKKSEAQ